MSHTPNLNEEYYKIILSLPSIPNACTAMMQLFIIKVTQSYGWVVIGPT